MRVADEKIRLAIVSPFLDRKNGTERIVIEWMSRLPDKFDVHVYSQRVEDVDPWKITWHRIPKLPGPHLLNFLWWFAANHLWRWWDSVAHGLAYDLIFSPGANCLDADVVSVHIVFGEFLRQARPNMKFSRNPLRDWPRLIHRRLYYRLIIAIERRIYSNRRTELVLIAKKTAADIKRFYGRTENMRIIYMGIDHAIFSSLRTASLREAARKQLGLADSDFAVLLIGNDLLKKGLAALVEAVLMLKGLPLGLIVVSRESPGIDRAILREMGNRIQFPPMRKDVEFYYAAADAYAGPSLEDTFAMPPVEAMACALPVIVSSENGAFEIMTDGVDGLILDDPRDSTTLAAMIRRLVEDQEFRNRLGRNAAVTAQQYTWESNGRDLATIFEEVLQRKGRPSSQTLTQET